ncbi:MAG TPA: potassium transporter Kup [Bdellovibrionales bacterium]|nr:potassium transporter Kup [Bdellovibrionales bacterium]
MSDSQGNLKHKAALSLAALGVVFGDIGTSPLYAFREAFHGSHSLAITPTNVLGVLSLVLWSLILVITVKYVFFVLRADNRGEGGVLTLTALAAPPRLVKRGQINYLALYLGLFGSALLFGEGVLTPAITVLGAVEGLELATPVFSHYVVPLTLVILFALFYWQHQGTARIGAIFGPVILIWFIVIGGLGIYGIIQNPVVIGALSPLHAVRFFQENGTVGFWALGAVMLAVTGAEALYADMGHFGRKPIQVAWFFAALPGLALNYFGQGAILLLNPENAVNPFYNLAPSWALYPLVALSTAAAVIASQALISGVYSLTRQAIQLGYSPRIRIVHTSSEEIGQIYVPHINWIMLAVTSLLVLEFGSSAALASAYGAGVSATMLITTTLVSLVALQRWRWNVFAVIGVFLLFGTIDVLFFSANLSKIPDGGWVPFTIAIIVFTCMTTWRLGRRVLMERLKEKSISFEEFIRRLRENPPVRVRGTAVFMTGDPQGVPPALLHNVRHNKAMHERNVLITVATEDLPHISKEERVDLIELAPQFYRITAYYGFMETPDIRDVLSACSVKGVDLKLEDISFFLGRETLIPTRRPGMAIWREYLFALMSRNAERATAYFNIPADQVVELGIQVEL